MQILIGENNSVLRQKSILVEKFDTNLKKTIQAMKVTMEENRGVGLAAPQVGINQALILITLDNKKIIPMVNPEIIEFSSQCKIGEEGCLSLPGIWGNVERAREIKLKYCDEKGNQQKIVLKDLNARIVQHEIDHLEGILFTDRILENNKILQTQKEA